MKRRFFLKILGLLGLQSAPWLDSILPGARFLAEAASPTRPADRAQPGPRSAPAWFEKYRVHAHTRLTLRMLGEDVFSRAAQHFRAMGVHVVVRHIKSGSEGAWWPSAVGATAPEAKNRNIAREIIESAHREGLNIIVYHRHMEDDHMAESHPDWVCKDWLGRPMRTRRGKYMCLNSPYTDYYLQRVTELVRMGADGFYFDDSHMPKTGCWCQYCRKLFREQTGQAHPRRPDARDPVWNKLIDFNNWTIERAFRKWSHGLHNENPNVVLLVSGNTWPAIVDRHLTDRVFRIADSGKSEFSLPAREFPKWRLYHLSSDMKPFETDAKIALGYTMIRDVADGRPGHIWIYGLKDDLSSLYAVAGVVSHGCIANLDIPENSISAHPFKKAVALGNTVSPYFSGSRPMRWAAVHFSEHGRDQYLASPEAALTRVLYPYYGAYRALLRSRVPVGVISDSQLEEGNLEDYKVLFLPAPKTLTGTMAQSVQKFRDQGNLVVENRDEWAWHANVGSDRAVNDFLAALGPQMSKVPVRVSGGPEKMHAVFFTNPAGTRLTVSLCNDFSWVPTGGPANWRERARGLSERDGIPSPCDGVKILLRGKRPPRKIFEAVSGKSLSTGASGEDTVIDVPRFEYMAVVVVEWEG